MLSFDTPHLVTALITLIIVIIAVAVHYEGLTALSRWAIRDLLPSRIKIAVLIFGQLMLHIVEICIFATAYYLLAQQDDYGVLLQLSYTGDHVPQIIGIFDYIYYSAVVYSTLGFGDLVPSGPLRILTGIESVAGLVLITWSASFTFLEMQRFWNRY
jgi:uncharacterized membrane protein